VIGRRIRRDLAETVRGVGCSMRLPKGGQLIAIGDRCVLVTGVRDLLFRCGGKSRRQCHQAWLKQVA
jgi:hypothetical protein